MSEVKNKMVKFFDGYKTSLYSKGSLIVEAGETPDNMFFIKSGKVRMYDISSAGCKLTLNILGVNAFFALPWLYGHSNNYYFDSLENTEIIKCPIDDLRSFLDNNPDQLNEILRRLTNGFDGLFMRLSTHMGGTAEQRILTELLIETWRFNKDEPATKTVKISVNDLTATTGLARETVSREVSKLIDKGLIKKIGRTIYINDINILQKHLFSK